MPQAVNASRSPAAPKCKERSPRKFYRPRDHEASPFFKIVRDRFEEFESVYPERFQQRYGYWRPVIRSSIDKFLKCGDLKEGFARVKCKDCGEEFFVALECGSYCTSVVARDTLVLRKHFSTAIFECRSRVFE